MKVLITGILMLSGFFMGRVYVAFFKREMYQRATAKGHWALTLISTFARHMFLFLVGFFILRMGVAALVIWLISFFAAFWYVVLKSEKG